MARLCLDVAIISYLCVMRWFNRRKRQLIQSCLASSTFHSFSSWSVWPSPSREFLSSASTSTLAFAWRQSRGRPTERTTDRTTLSPLRYALGEEREKARAFFPHLWNRDSQSKKKSLRRIFITSLCLYRVSELHFLDSAKISRAAVWSFIDRKAEKR